MLRSRLSTVANSVHSSQLRRVRVAATRVRIDAVQLRSLVRHCAGKASTGGELVRRQTRSDYCNTHYPSYLFEGLDLSKFTVEELGEAFDRFDVDGSGTLSKEEVEAMLNAIQEGARANDLERIMEEFDLDKALLHYPPRSAIKHARMKSFCPTLLRDRCSTSMVMS